LFGGEADMEFSKDQLEIIKESLHVGADCAEVFANRSYLRTIQKALKLIESMEQRAAMD